MKMLFHGSSVRLPKPYFGGGNPISDYGPGFYCTEDEKMAALWSVAPDHDGFINTYAIEMDGLTVLDLLWPRFTILSWMALLVKNRPFPLSYPRQKERMEYLIENFAPPLTGVDIVIGYRADDSYFAFASDFLAGSISLTELTRAMKIGNLGNQLVLVSEKAYSHLSFLGARHALRDDFLYEKNERERETLHQYHHQNEKEAAKGELFLSDIVKEGIKDGDYQLYF